MHHFMVDCTKAESCKVAHGDFITCTQHQSKTILMPM